MVLTILLIYFLSFTDKLIEGVPALGERALELRERYQIEIDELDYPVSAQYTDSVTRLGCRVLHTSRWMNGATVHVLVSDTATLLPQLRECSFVREIELTRQEPQIPEPAVGDHPRHAPPSSEDSAHYGASLEQLAAYNLLPLHQAGYEGQGIRVAVIDGGFACMDTLSQMCSRVVDVYDRTDDVASIYDPTLTHGTMCLSIIAGDKDGYRGAATRAEFVLIRSEENVTESRKELDNLVSSLELADSLGAQIATISLGYNLMDDTLSSLTYDDLTGRRVRGSMAATIAARKGMLVCVAAGNDRAKPWGRISSPADADSILAVGAVTYDSLVTVFSSYGPSADGRIKPDVCAVGQQVAVYKADGETTKGNGTSFATPLIAGLAASLWSALPDENAMQIRERIIRSAHRYENPDNDLGYGVPDAWTAYVNTASQTLLPPDMGSPIAIKRLVGSHLYIIVGGRKYNLLGF